MRSRLAEAAVVGFLVASGAVGCSSDDSGLPEPVAPQTAGPPAEEVVELSAEEQEAVDGARAAFDAFMTAYNEILTAGEPATEAVLGRIFAHAGGPVARTVQDEVFDSFEARQRQDGQVDWSFVGVVDLDLEYLYSQGDDEYVVPLVWLQYCIDATEWEAVAKDAGSTVVHDGARLIQPGNRVLVTAEINYFDSSPIEGLDREPTWIVAVWDDEEGAAC